MNSTLTVGGLWLVVACAAIRSHSTQHAPRTVAIWDFQFRPAELTVTVGDTVVWTNHDALIHSSAADSGAWSSPEMRQGEGFRFVTTKPGRFPYHCGAHPVMRAALVVRP